MSETNNKVRPVYNCERLYIYPMIDEENEVYSDTPLTFVKRLTSYNDSVASNNSELYGDGELVESEVEEGAGTIALGIHGMTDEEYAAIFGCELRNGTVIESDDDEPVYCCVILMARSGKHKVNVRKWPKVRFQKPEESVSQKESNKTYSFLTLNGSFIECDRLGVKRAKKTVTENTAEGRAFIEGWFGSPEFFTAGELINTSYLTQEGSEEAVSVIREGNVTIHGAASGGSSPYTYSYSYQVYNGGTWSRYTSAGENISGASDTIAVTEGLTYRFKSVVTDSVGQSLTKTFRLTAAAAE